MPQPINTVSRHNQQTNPTPNPLALLNLQGNSGATNVAYTPSIPSPAPSSVINLSHSSDVVFGSLINYQGPVTINQYLETTSEEYTKPTTGRIHSTQNTTNPVFRKKLQMISRIFIRIIVIGIVVAGIFIYIQFNNSNNATHKPTRGPILFDSSYERGTFPNLGNGHLVVDRIQWDTSELAKPLTVPLKHPIPYVLISHVGRELKPCENIHKCSIEMQTLQDAAIAEKNLADIYSNFYIANDGNIYVGRGWYFANTYAIDTLAITFLGDFNRYVPNEKLFEGLSYLMNYAVTNKHLVGNYKLIALNQTKHADGTGDNIYRKIKHWPHFYPCNTENNVKCFRELEVS